MDAPNLRLEKLHAKRLHLHEYIRMKLDEHDYHGVADAAMDCRELEVEVKIYQQLAEAAR